MLQNVKMDLFTPKKVGQDVKVRKYFDNCLLLRLLDKRYVMQLLYRSCDKIYKFCCLTFILPKLKVISLCH